MTADDWRTACTRELIGTWVAVYADRRGGTWRTELVTHLVLQMRGQDRENRCVAGALRHGHIRLVSADYVAIVRRNELDQHLDNQKQRRTT